MSNETYNQCENCYEHLTIAIGGNLSPEMGVWVQKSLVLFRVTAEEMRKYLTLKRNMLDNIETLVNLT